MAVLRVSSGQDVLRHFSPETESNANHPASPAPAATSPAATNALLGRPLRTGAERSSGLGSFSLLRFVLWLRGNRTISVILRGPDKQGPQRQKFGMAIERRLRGRLPLDAHDHVREHDAVRPLHPHQGQVCHLVGGWLREKQRRFGYSTCLDIQEPKRHAFGTAILRRHEGRFARMWNSTSRISSPRWSAT